MSEVRPIGLIVNPRSGNDVRRVIKRDRQGYDSRSSTAGSRRLARAPSSKEQLGQLQGIPN